MTNCSSNYIFGVKVTLSQPLTVTALATIIATADASEAYIIGLYTDTGTQPGNLLVESTQQIMSPGGAQEIAVTPTAVAAGTYWVVTSTGTSSNTWHWSWDGTFNYFFLSYTYTGGLPNPMPAGGGTPGGAINYYLVGYQ